VISLSLFGTTTGLEVLTSPLSNTAPFKFEEAWIGISLSQLTPQPNKDAFVVFRKSAGNQLVTWVGLYRPAREIGYDRPGCFYGAGAWIVDCVADANILANTLWEMANQIQSKAMNGDRFVKKIADAGAEFSPPSHKSSLLASLAAIKSGLKSEGETAFIVEAANPIHVIEWAQLAPSASHFSKVVIGTTDQRPSSGQSSAIKPFMSLSLAIDHSYQILLADSLNFQRQISDKSDRDREFKRNLDALERRISEKEDDLQRAYATVDRLNNDLKQAQSRIDSLVVSRGIDYLGDLPNDRSLPVAGAGRTEASDRHETPGTTRVSPGEQASSATLPSRSAQPAHREPVTILGAPPAQTRFRSINKILMASIVLVVAIGVFVVFSYRQYLGCLMMPASLCGPAGEKERSPKTPDDVPRVPPRNSEENPDDDSKAESSDIPVDLRSPSNNPKKKK